jgi:predicted phage terminase large subunit-like protein
LLEGVSSPEELNERVQSLSREEQREILNDARRARAHESDVDYVEYVHAENLGDGDGFLPPHIVDLFRFVDHCIETHQSGVALLPRGSSKTTSFTIGKGSHLIAKNPDIRIGLFSNTATQSEAFSRAIRTTISDNERHAEIFGETFKSSKWTDGEWIHPRSRHARGSKDVTVYAQGTGGPIISKRFDLIIMDDILDEENTKSALLMEQVDTWFWKTVKPTLAPGGIIIVIGTRWAEGDLYQILTDPKEKGGKGWPLLHRSALLTDAEGELYSYWPERWSVDALLHEQEDMGSAFFSVAYQNDVSGLMKGNVFHRLRDGDYFTVLPDDRTFVFKMGIDLASSEKERADYTARVTTAVDDQGEFWVMAAYRDKREDHHAEFVFDGYQAYPQIALVIAENNQFQSTLVQNVLRDYPGIPIEGRKSDVDKVTRARAVAAKYEAHKVHHHASLKGSEFERELLSFPKGHDDLVDALGFSMDLQGGGFFFGSLRHGSRTRR